MPNYYAGLGAPQPSERVCRLLQQFARRLTLRDVKQPTHEWVLRTGLTEGAGAALGNGARGHSQMFLAAPDHLEAMDHPATIVRRPTPEAFALAQANDPEWASRPGDEAAVKARAMHLLFGYGASQQDVSTGPRPSSAQGAAAERSAFVVLWTPEGSLDGTDTEDPECAFAMQVASKYAIPVLNVALPSYARLVSDIANGRVGLETLTALETAAPPIEHTAATLS